VMSPDETKRLLAVAKTLKARVLFALDYGCGLRASEVVRLRVGDIDSAQGIIRVVQSKGRKDRNVMLSPEVLALLGGRRAHAGTTSACRQRTGGTRQATLQRLFRSAGCLRSPPRSRSCLLGPAQSSTAVTPAVIKSP
ncbi:MAG: tyrosine-type recombinase/integrase, partial [Pseudolabrys sp.]